MATPEKDRVLDLKGLGHYDSLIKQYLLTHVEDKNNPHNVNKTQIGLDKVENKSASDILSELTSDIVITALGYTPQQPGAGGGRYGVASETEAGIIMSGGDISVDENGVVTVTGMNGLNIGSDVQPIYFKDGKPTVGHYTLAEAAGKGVTNLTEAKDLGWVNASVGSLFVPTINTLTYWNGAYNPDNASNIEYIKLGKLGSMATKSADDYLLTTDIADWAKGDAKPTYTAEEVGADAKGSADTALAAAKSHAESFTNTKIAELINSAPETMDTLGELAILMAENQDTITLLNNAIANKASTTDLTTHTGNTSNPHGVTKAQVGLDKVDNTADADKSVKHATSADTLTVIEANTDVFRNVWFAEASDPNKSVYNAAFQYNPATDTLKVGNITGKANSASTADALAVATAVGSATNPVYIDATGKPVKTTYTLGASVPADAKFTDTTYTLESFGINALASEINFLSGVTSNIQTQLNGKAISNHAHADYLPLAGGTLSSEGAAITSPGADGRRLRFIGAGLRFSAAKTGWASGWNFQSNDDNTLLGSIGAHGEGDSIIYYYIGASYDSAKIKMYNNGNLDLGGNIIINGKASADVSATSTNPKITFMDINTQPVHLIYSDFDAYRSPAGLKVVGESPSGAATSSPAWFEVEGDIYSKTSVIDNKVTLAYSDTTDSLSFNFA